VSGSDLNESGRSTRSGRERLVTAAYELFTRSGVRAVGVDALTDTANVAKMTLYRNFNSKNDLALAYLDLREERWVQGWLKAETQARAASPAGQLLATFDIFMEWFERDDFEGCPFVRSLLEFEDRGDRVRQACVEHLASIRAYLCELATEAGARDPQRFAAQWHLLLNGAIVAAHEGDLDAAVKAREVGTLLLERDARSEPAPIGCCAHLDVALVGPEHVVRLAGDLDAEAAAAVAAVIDSHEDPPVRLDLAEIEFVDVAGLRALRGTRAHPITIAAPSDAVLRLVDLLGWDSDPGVELQPARAA
jgi:AcrR family transcriptional regulator